MGGVHSFAVGLGRVVRGFGPVVLRLGAGVVVLWFLVRLVGAAPFVEGVRAVTWPAVVAAVGLTVVTSVCSAWRWRVVARVLGMGLGLRSATGAYYRSLFLNSVLVGGVIGDVHRALAHGRRSGDVGRGVRAVGWERLWGQVVQAGVTVVVLAAVPSPVRPALLYVVVGLAVVGGVVGGVVWAMRGTARAGRSRWSRTLGVVAGDLRCGLLARGVWPRLMVASVLVVAGHTATFVIAARVAGCSLPLGELVALLLVVQTAVVIPLSVGGWGPREGVAAWAFAAAGVGAATGVTIATLYAVLMLIAVAPGLGLLVTDTVHRGRGRGPGPPDEPHQPELTPQPLQGVHG